MKHPNSISDFIGQRDKELLMAYRKVLAEKKHFCFYRDFKEIVAQPCSRFWVSEERAAIVLSLMLRGEPVLKTMRQPKRDMFLEIYRRTLELQKTMPGAKFYDVVFEVVNSPAPHFYISPKRAMNIICIIKGKRKRGQKQ